MNRYSKGKTRVRHWIEKRKDGYWWLLCSVQYSEGGGYVNRAGCRRTFNEIISVKDDHIKGCKYARN